MMSTACADKRVKYKSKGARKYLGGIKENGFIAATCARDPGALVHNIKAKTVSVRGKSRLPAEIDAKIARTSATIPTKGLPPLHNGVINPTKSVLSGVFWTKVLWNLYESAHDASSRKGKSKGAPRQRQINPAESKL